MFGFDFVGGQGYDLGFVSLVVEVEGGQFGVVGMWSDDYYLLIMVVGMVCMLQGWFVDQLVMLVVQVNLVFVQWFGQFCQVQVV